ncbi:MAG: haloacid dehalogenase-like hydrolase [Chloroflexota bacterium]|nr:haloacid dehalogenase-like hydrolase [Chloroflexota bacterium]
MTKLFLFDIDMTLLWSGGAGVKAMNLAFAQAFGISDAYANVEFTGRSDASIFRDAARLHGLDGDFASLLARFQDVYHAILAQTLGETQGRVMPGIPELLAALRAAPGAFLGLATGNFRQAARLKLEHYGLHDFFLAGGFGDDSQDRAQIVALAIERLAQAASQDGPRQVCVIGDTPLDVAAARANAARPVAVATGSFSVQDLEAAGAELVFPDFSRWQEALGALLA